MKNIIEKLRSQYFNTCIIILSNDLVYIYDRDARLVEYISNYVSNKNVIIIKYLQLRNLLNNLKNRKISYIVFDSDINYEIYEYYYLESNKYYFYISKSKKYNWLRKCLISILNLLYS